MSKEMHSIKYVSTGTNVGKASSENLGIPGAKGENILFIDDDCIAHENWAIRICFALETNPIVTGAVFSSVGYYFKLCHIVSYKTQCDYRRGDEIPLFPSIMKYHRYAIDKESKNILDMNQRYYCNRPWLRIHVFADGAITPCEFDITREVLLGNIYDNKSVNSCWNSDLPP